MDPPRYALSPLSLTLCPYALLSSSGSVVASDHERPYRSPCALRSGRRQLTESEEEDLEAEAEFEAEGEEAEEEGVTYDEYLASRRPVALPKLPEQRKANEGVAMKVVQRDARTNLEVRASTPRSPLSSLPTRCGSLCLNSSSLSTRRISLYVWSGDRKPSSTRYPHPSIPLTPARSALQRRSSRRR